MAISGEKRWPRMGRNRWPLTACGGDEKQAASKVKELSAKVAKLLVTDPLARQLRAVAQALQTELMLDADAFRALMKP